MLNKKFKNYLQQKIIKKLKKLIKIYRKKTK